MYPPQSMGLIEVDTWASKQSPHLVPAASDEQALSDGACTNPGHTSSRFLKEVFEQ